MRPKPSREWVMQELERLGVRVVSGRLGRKAGEEEEAPLSKKSSGKIAFVDEVMIGWFLKHSSYPIRRTNAREFFLPDLRLSCSLFVCSTK